MREIQVQNLNILYLLIVDSVLNAMSAALLMAYCDWIFRNKKHLFYNNPANTYTYHALHALEEISVITIAEALVNKRDIGVDFSKKREIIRHRHAISHPYTVVWKDGNMQKFYDNKRHILDIKAIMVWDIFKIIVDILKNNKQKVIYDDVVIQAEMATTFKTILDYSLKEEMSSDIVTEAIILNEIKNFKNTFLDFIVKKINK